MGHARRKKAAPREARRIGAAFSQPPISQKPEPQKTRHPHTHILHIRFSTLPQGSGHNPGLGAREPDGFSPPTCAADLLP